MIPARVVKSLTGLSKNQIKKLTPIFSACWENVDIKNGLHANPDRPGRPPEVKRTYILIFVLAYLKTNLTFDALAMMFSIKRSTFYDHVRRGLQVLEMALDDVGATPLEDIDSQLTLLAILRGKKHIFLDATERPIRRPKRKQRQFYSGKKKRHTVKYQILSDEDKKIIALSETVAGSAHDFQIFKRSRLKNNIPKRITTHVDLGYQGIHVECPTNVFSIPEKKPKNAELTSAQKKGIRRSHRFE
jgi:predicted DNA-binding protein YlxM (UPF0122 family)